ncbi:hypothetical protein ABT160_31260 [Streptomyces sp. NPDC001941]|uniref:hypothetical protein n=1 Tax=Streptomyces sp. NPDC001941 TaxID=3154659 RepID=UPI0033320255
MSLGEDNTGYGGVGGTGQTRTRLPESPGADPYGTPRRPARTSRSLIMVVGVVVLLIAAIAFANRSGDEGPTAKDGTKGAPGTAPTAASGERPVEGKNGSIPVGYPRTEEGAQSAASNYAVPLGSADMFDRDRRHAIVDTVYAPDVANARQGDLDKVYSDKDFLSRIGLRTDGTAPEGMTFVSRIIPVGTKIDGYAGDTATIAVWYSSLFGLAGDGSKSPVSESWYTTTYQLRWIDGDWKVTDFTQKPGPVPVGRDQRASDAQEMADAVNQFGGFTYAR